MCFLKRWCQLKIFAHIGLNYINIQLSLAVQNWRERLIKIDHVILMISRYCLCGILVSKKWCLTQEVWVGTCLIRFGQIMEWPQMCVVGSRTEAASSFLAALLNVCLDFSVCFHLRCPRFDNLPPGFSVFSNVICNIFAAQQQKWVNGFYRK